MTQVRTADCGITQDGSVQLYVPPGGRTVTNANFNVAANFNAPGSAAIASIPAGQWLLVWRPASGNATYYPVTQGQPAPPT